MIDVGRAGTRVPAWMISIAMHIVLVVLLGMLIRPTLRGGGGGDESDRSAAIVLAQVSNDDERVEYFDESDATDAAESAAQGVENGVPDEAAAPDALDISLPDSATVLNAPGAVSVGQASADAGPRARLGIQQGVGDILADEAARNVGGGPVGPQTSLSLFGGGASSGNSFVFVIDRSRSMGNEGLGALTAARQELNRALKPLTDQHRFQIIAYHHQRTFLEKARLLPASEDNKGKVRGFFSGLAAFGGTNHELALYAALTLEPDVIYLLTDGADPYLRPHELDRIRGKAQRQGTTIHCIQFGFGTAGDGRGFMSQLARDNGGAYQFVNMRK